MIKSQTRLFGVTLFIAAAYAVGCGGDSNGSASPCTKVCNCVVAELGAEARTDCNTQCAEAMAASDPVADCRSRLASYRVATCDDECEAFAPSTGSGGKSSSGGAGNDTGGSDSSGGEPPDTGGAGGAGGGSGTGGRSTGGISGTGGAGGSVTGGVVGRPCVSNTDCGGSGFACLTAASDTALGGGPANGYCVADCSDDPSVCQTADPNSVCVQFEGASGAGSAYCLEGCLVGASQPSKCHDRADVACDDQSSTVPGEGFCRPVCRGDFDCGARQCDLGSGLCVDEAVRGDLPIGSACDPTAATEPCNGICIPLTEDEPTIGTCSGVCVVGAPGCGIDPDATEPPKAVCLFPFTQAEGDIGDFGLCGTLCNCDDDCTTQGDVCNPLSAAVAEGAGYPGFCGPVGPSGATIACD